MHRGKGIGLIITKPIGISESHYRPLFRPNVARSICGSNLASSDHLDTQSPRSDCKSHSGAAYKIITSSVSELSVCDRMI